MKIRELTSSERPAWDELARRHGSLFNRLDWLDLFGSRMRLLGLFDAGDTLVGGAAVYAERRGGLTVFRRAPFTPTCGPFLAVKSSNPVAVLEERRAAVECLASWLDERHPALCMLPLDRRIADALPFFWRGYKVVPQYTYLLDLAPPLEQIRRQMSPDRRNDVSKAVRDGVTARPAQGLDEVRDLVLATFGRQDKGVDRDVLEGILTRHARPGNHYAYVACRDGTPTAACFVVHDDRTAYYLLGGYCAENRHHGAGALAVWEAIRHAKEAGLDTFDFEGSVIPPIERFFRGFGGRLTPYFTVNKGWWPLETAMKFLRRGLF